MNGGSHVEETVGEAVFNVVSCGLDRSMWTCQNTSFTELDPWERKGGTIRRGMWVLFPDAPNGPAL
jgi:hypothetical protein